MLDRPPFDLEQEDKIESPDEQNNGSQPNLSQLGEFLGEILLKINDQLPSMKDKAHLASVNQHFSRFFQYGIEKKVAEEAAECAINPTKENVEKLKKLLKDCPALVLYPMTVKNRHGMVIKGTVYQIALHEGDDELIDDEIKPAFKRLHNGLEEMEAQRKAWLPEGWTEAEEQICAGACKAIDDVFTAFKNASNPNEVTELQQYPYTITINNQEANEALDAFRKAIDALYKQTDKVIVSGRDPSIRLIEQIIDRYKENYDALGGDDSPRNNAIMRAVFGYSQRPAPINFMQAFAMGIYYLIQNKEKLIRSFEYRNWKEHFILPLDSDPHFRVGYEYFAVGRGMGWVGPRAGTLGGLLQDFLSIKNSSYTKPVLCTTQPRTLNSSNL